LSLSKIIKTPIFCQLLIFFSLFGFLPSTNKKIISGQTRQISPINFPDYAQFSTPTPPTGTAPSNALPPTTIHTPTQSITITKNTTGTLKAGTVTVTPTPAQFTTTPTLSPNYFRAQSQQKHKTYCLDCSWRS
jgi:hypothetical protein